MYNLQIKKDYYIKSEWIFYPVLKIFLVLKKKGKNLLVVRSVLGLVLWTHALIKPCSFPYIVFSFVLVYIISNLNFQLPFIKKLKNIVNVVNGLCNLYNLLRLEPNCKNLMFLQNSEEKKIHVHKETLIKRHLKYLHSEKLWRQKTKDNVLDNVKDSKQLLRYAEEAMDIRSSRSLNLCDFKLISFYFMI